MSSLLLNGSLNAGPDQAWGYFRIDKPNSIRQRVQVTDASAAADDDDDGDGDGGGGVVCGAVDRIAFSAMKVWRCDKCERCTG